MIAVDENKKHDTQWRLDKIAPMSDSEYLRWIGLLEERTGITLPELRKSFLLSKLSIRMRELGINEYKSYFAYVTHGRAGLVEWETLVDRLTVHETRFFRDTQALNFIKQAYLEKINFEVVNPSIHIWSVGCATGEEPYSLMMYIDKYITEKEQDCYLSVTASDISHDALSMGKQAVYHRNRFTNVPAEYLEAYVDEYDPEHYIVKEELRKRICFNRMNLADFDDSPVGMMEIILCQNVLIYFKRDRRRAILDKLVNHLVPGGFLVLGAGEIIDWSHAEMSQVKSDGVLAFQKTASANQQEVNA